MSAALPRARTALLAVLALAAIAARAPADARVELEEIRGAASIQPGHAELGAALTYTATVRSVAPMWVRVIAPPNAGALHWGIARIWDDTDRNGRARAVGPGAWVPSNARIEIPLQVFALGDVAVPGVEVEVKDGRSIRRMRLPLARVVIVPVIAANDSSAELRAPRGPIGAPWWERVPWLTVLAVAAVAGAITALIVRRLRRKRPAPAAAPPPVARPVDPGLIALRELESLRRLGLPARGEVAEHAFRLTRIVRRFLEAAVGAARPGDTTPELVDHLAATPLARDEIQRLEALLRYWDRVKFARAGTTPDEAARAEAAVESFVRHTAPPRTERAA